MPELEKVRAKYEAKGVKFLAVSLEPDVTTVKKAAEELKIEMRVAVTEEEVLAPFGAKRTPATVFIDKSGKIVAAASGEKSERFLEARTKELLE